MIKIGFSSTVCPGWELERMVDQAAAMGFDGVELRGLRGELDLPTLPELNRHAEHTVSLFQEKQVELACLGTSATLSARNPRKVAHQKGVVIEFLELASRLCCPQVRLFVGEVPHGDDRRACLSRVADGLRSLIPAASRCGVTLLVENGGDFCRSDDLWYLVDALGHPSIQCCWNQCNAMSDLERPTNSIPRLGRKMGLVHLCDATFDEQGVLLDYKPLGRGQCEIARQIELLRGIIYRQYVMFDWPKLWIDSLPEPEAVLPEVASYLRSRIDERQAVLSAYKGDKHAPRLADPRPAGV